MLSFFVAVRYYLHVAYLSKDSGRLEEFMLYSLESHIGKGNVR